MSQKETIVTGIVDASEKEPAYEGRTSEFYQRGVKTAQAFETIVPEVSVRQEDEPKKTPKPKETGKPIVGFLYSISRTNMGEYWPLHVGLNTIGSSSKCDVQLMEGTISSEHAELVIRQLKNPAKTIASITDARSTNGTMINGESLGFSPVECFNGNVITFGENYQCVFILIDAASFDLKVAEGFIPVGPQKKEKAPAETIQDENRPPRFFHNPANPDTQGTVGMDGASGNMGGGTIGM